MQGWPSAKYMTILVINLELIGEGLLSHIENLNTSQSLTPRLQRLFMSQKTIEHMTWHHLHDVVDKVMVHPYNGEAW
jgi:hypothetical protein